MLCTFSQGGSEDIQTHTHIMKSSRRTTLYYTRVPMSSRRVARVRAYYASNFRRSASGKRFFAGSGCDKTRILHIVREAVCLRVVGELSRTPTRAARGERERRKKWRVRPIIVRVHVMRVYSRTALVGI